MEFETSVHTLIQELNEFDYQIEFLDRIWDVIFPDKKAKWHHMHVIHSYGVYYISLSDPDLPVLEVKSKKKIGLAPSWKPNYSGDEEELSPAWGGFITAALSWLKYVKKDWIKANKQVEEKYPLKYRTGIVPHSLVRASLSDIRRVDLELGKSKTKKFIRLVENDYFRSKQNFVCTKMCANDFFDYCKIAYIAAKPKGHEIDQNLSGLELYKQYADGRDNGLLDINPDSTEEFADWIDGTHPKKTDGGHPWEIRRGGNTTHIDLYVSRPSYHEKEGFIVTLFGPSTIRLKETICMFLGLYDAGLPITIRDPEDIRKRLLAQDNIGIVPCYETLHRADENFTAEQAVFDVMHFDELGKFKRRIKPFITWDALPILKPKYVF